MVFHADKRKSKTKSKKPKWGKIGAPGSRKRRVFMAKIGRKGGKA